MDEDTKERIWTTLLWVGFAGVVLAVAFFIIGIWVPDGHVHNAALATGGVFMPIGIISLIVYGANKGDW